MPYNVKFDLRGRAFLTPWALNTHAVYTAGAWVVTPGLSKVAR